MIGVAFAAMLAGLSQDLPSTLYLTCQVTAPPSTKMADLYRIPPSDGMTVAKDLMMQGAVSLMKPPPETWIVNPSERSIKAGLGNWQWTFENANFGPSEVHGTLTTAGGRLIMVTFNRISGTAETSFVMPRQESEEWRQKHGKAFPVTWSWKQSCTASPAPRF